MFSREKVVDMVGLSIQLIFYHYGESIAVGKQNSYRTTSRLWIQQTTSIHSQLPQTLETNKPMP